MYVYVKGFCPTTHYTCLMPIKYEKKRDGNYHKVQCVCSHSASCNNKECEHFNNAPEIQLKWKLRETILE